MIVVAIVVVWEAVAASGLLFRDVVPSLVKIAAALGRMLVNAELYSNLGTTAFEVVVALLIGGSLGVAVGLLLSGNRLLGGHSNLICTILALHRRSSSFRS
jgi:ABC-type nitrate/sulfonate/bicarbonate transport system permease component